MCGPHGFPVINPSLATRGHGTYTCDGKLYASVAGVVERVNKLICVKPLKSRYEAPAVLICARTRMSYFHTVGIMEKLEML